jgi:hypothetical protein
MCSYQKNLFHVIFNCIINFAIVLINLFYLKFIVLILYYYYIIKVPFLIIIILTFIV